MRLLLGARVHTLRLGEFPGWAKHVIPASVARREVNAFVKLASWGGRIGFLRVVSNYFDEVLAERHIALIIGWSYGR